jgi:hypothetical protein
MPTVPRFGLGAGTAVGLGRGAAVGKSEVVATGSVEATGAGVVAAPAAAASTVTRPDASGSRLGLEFNEQPARHASANKQVRLRVNDDGHTMKLILKTQGLHHQETRARRTPRT